MRIDRMLAIVVILLNRRKIKAQELAERFEVSLRTVYRDIEAINRAGIPVFSNQGTNGGYEIPENYKLSRQVLSPADMRSILSALKGISTTVEDRELSLIYEKVLSLLPEMAAGEKGTADSLMVFDTVGWDNSNRLTTRIQTLYDCAKACRLVRLTYTDSSGRSSQRLFEPMTIVQRGVSWYVYGFCRQKSDYRIFKLTRMRTLTPLTDTFPRKEIPYRSSRFSEDWQTSRQPETAVLKFSSGMKHIIDEYFDSARVVDQTVDHITVALTVPKGPWMVAMILGYGDQVTVISPDVLRDEIRAMAQNILNQYKK